MIKILIIKHGSLGDIIFSLPIIHSIHAHFSDKKIDLLTERKYSFFLRNSKYFEKIIQDNRSSNFFLTVKLLFKLLNNKYDFIIDLQNSSRTSYYNLFFRIFSKAKILSSRNFAHFRYIIPKQGIETTTQGLFNQVKLLNINETNSINYDWLNNDLDTIYDNKTILFIPGVSSKGLYKQWNPEKFGLLAKYFEDKNYQICVVGTSNDIDSASPILNSCKNIINNIDNSPPEIIYSIAKKSKLVITNDTGPGHLAALSGVNILWIANDNDITRANIRNNNQNFKILSRKINDIGVEAVISFIKKNNLL